MLSVLLLVENAKNPEVAIRKMMAKNLMINTYDALFNHFHFVKAKDTIKYNPSIAKIKCYCLSNSTCY